MTLPMVQRSRRWALGGAAAAYLLLLTACGAPTSGAVQQVTSVPYDLMSPAAPVTTAPTTKPEARPRVYLVRDDLLVPVPGPDTEGADTPTAVTELLQALAQGPREGDRNRGLSSALGSDVAMTLTRIDGDTAVVDVDAGAQLPSAGRLPLAVAQIVLTVVSVPGVENVELTVGGEPIQAPLPDGALTERPLDAGDYSTLLAPASS